MSFPRYPAYKDSGVACLGEVPAHWGVCAVRRVVDRIEQGWSPECEATPAEDDAWGVLKAGCLNGGNFDPSENKTLPLGFVPMPEYEVHRGDVLMSRASGSPELVGSVALVKDTKPKLMLSDKIFRIQPGLKMSPAHIVWAMNSLPIRGQIEQALSGGNGLANNLPQSVLLAFYLALPPRNEQEAIVSFLDLETAKIDALVAEQEQLITLLKEKRQGVISQAVTKGLDPSVPMKDSGVEWLGEVPAHWEVRQVRSLCSFLTSGPRGWSERVGGEGALFVQSGDLADNLEVAFEQAKRVVVVDDAEAARTRLRAGDVLVCITGAKTGNVAVCTEVEEDAYINQHLCLIRPTDDVLPWFTGVFLKSDAGQRYFGVAQYGLKQGLSLENVKSAPVVVPPVSEQRAIVAAVARATTQMDLLIGEAVQSIELLRERRAALISAAVTGQIDVRHGMPA